jgi:hypothetical protein
MTEVEKRISNANRAYYALLLLLKSQSVLRGRKNKKTFKVSVRQAATYEAGSWTVNNDVDKRLATFERKVLRRLFGGIKVN